MSYPPILHLVGFFSLLLLSQISNGFVLPAAFLARGLVSQENKDMDTCRILNHESVESFPKQIMVNGTPYTVLGQIQHGATSKVFHAIQEENSATDEQKRCLAVKVVDMSKIERQKQNQVTNEAELLWELNQKKIARVPQLITIEHNPDKQMSMVMELAHHDLFDEITPKMGRDEHQWARHTLAEILRALQPVHENEIVHGDIKPENMAFFPTKDGKLVLKLIDFGGAMRAEKLSSACEDIVTGTIMYMSPEQVAWCASHGEEPFLARKNEFQLSKKSDMWSVGVILYQMLFGRNPYSGMMRQFDGLEEPERTEQSDNALRKVILEGHEPIEFEQHYGDQPMLHILRRTLDREPAKRPGVNELLQELAKLGEWKTAEQQAQHQVQQQAQQQMKQLMQKQAQQQAQQQMQKQAQQQMIQLMQKQAQQQAQQQMQRQIQQQQTKQLMQQQVQQQKKIEEAENNNTTAFKMPFQQPFKMPFQQPFQQILLSKGQQMQQPEQQPAQQQAQQLMKQQKKIEEAENNNTTAFKMPFQQPFKMPFQQPFKMPFQQPFKMPFQQPFKMPFQQPFQQILLSKGLQMQQPAQQQAQQQMQQQAQQQMKQLMQIEEAENNNSTAFKMPFQQILLPNGIIVPQQQQQQMAPQNILIV